MLEITEAAAEVLERAYEAATHFNPDARIRVFRNGDRIETGLADAPRPGDRVVEHAGLPLFVEEGIAGLLDVSAEHDRLVVLEAP